jgi:xanthine/CO dehydrogenase XdhC/CoxF family maturation factor
LRTVNEYLDLTVSELSQLIAAIEEDDDRPWALATVVGVSGSTYRLPGARQLLRADGTSVGTVSGGCLDTDLLRIVGEVIASDTVRFVTYNLSADDDEIWGFGLGCNGVTELLVEPASMARPLLRELDEARRVARPIAVVTGLDGPTGGARLLTGPDGNPTGTLGSAILDGSAVDAATEALRHGGHRHLTLADGTRAFIEVQVPPPRLLVCGAGHDAIPMVQHGAALGWTVTVVDDRAAYLTEERFPQAAALHRGSLQEITVDDRTDAVVMSHNFLRDTENLRQLINSPARYVGMLGPRERTARIIADLREEGVQMPEASLERLYSPAGLDVGAEGPDEIARAILAEIQAVTRGRGGGSLRDRKGGIHQGPAGESPVG